MQPSLDFNGSYALFGLSKPWLSSSWTTTDDRVRGGASRSYLSDLPNSCVHFYGHLDTSTLGGAGFASQFSPPEAAGSGEKKDEKSWNLQGYDGIEVEIQKIDDKIYTLILRDEPAPEKREDGRERASTNWEVDFQAEDGNKRTVEKGSCEGAIKIRVPWTAFKATYRGKEKTDAGELKMGQISRIGLMMRSYFGKQDGYFSLELKSICAKREIARGM